LDLCKAEDILCAKVSDYDDLVKNQQIQHLGMIAEVESSVGGFSYSMPGFPINSREASKQGYRGPPGIGADNEEILKRSDC
jgi:crotonobetainyl-CoA:carnitine CoA-transferase CaiB-like acyl-CoA transferase